jgi:hypothetical protein
MSLEGWGLLVTFILACTSATIFLTVRCEGKGQPFGRRSRPWALAVIGLTGAISMLGAWGVTILGHYLPGVIVGLGIAAPSALCLERIREGLGDRQGVLSSAVTLGVGMLLGRLDDAMAEDREAWCERLIDPKWDDNTLLMATDEYYDHLISRLSGEECTRYRIVNLNEDIVARLTIAKLIDSLPLGASDSKQDLIFKAFAASSLAGSSRYMKYFDDLDVLGKRLRHDARQDMGRMLAIAYYGRLRRLRRYKPVAAIPEPAD